MMEVKKLILRACETLWSAREMASVALSAAQERHTENMFHILLSQLICHFYLLK